MELKKLFGKKLREIRISRGLTQEKTAEQLGIQPENYSRLENGLSFPKPDNLVKLSMILEVEIAEFFQFQTCSNYEEIQTAVIEKLRNDKETTILIYKFLKSIGKI